MARNPKKAATKKQPPKKQPPKKTTTEKSPPKTHTEKQSKQNIKTIVTVQNSAISTLQQTDYQAHQSERRPIRIKENYLFKNSN